MLLLVTFTLGHSVDASYLGSQLILMKRALLTWVHMMVVTPPRQHDQYHRCRWAWRWRLSNKGCRVSSPGLQGPGGP